MPVPNGARALTFTSVYPSSDGANLTLDTAQCQHRSASALHFINITTTLSTIYVNSTPHYSLQTVVSKSNTCII